MRPTAPRHCKTAGYVEGESQGPCVDSPRRAIRQPAEADPEHHRRGRVRGEEEPDAADPGFVDEARQCLLTTRCLQSQGGVLFEVTPFDPLDRSTWSALEGEAVMLGRLLAERDPLVYGRFRRWWDKLPSDGRRTLPIA